MSYNKELDEVIAEHELVAGTYAMVRSYDGGPRKLQVVRRTEKRDGTAVEYAAKRLTVEEVSALAQVIAQIVTEMGE